jgi:hypothetical protein
MAMSLIGKRLLLARQAVSREGPPDFRLFAAGPGGDGTGDMSGRERGDRILVGEIS